MADSMVPLKIFKYMKTTSFFLTILLVLAALGTNAQTKKYAASNSENEEEAYQSPFSFKVGYNISNVTISPEPVNFVTDKKSFHAGIVAPESPIGRGIVFQPELLYSLQGFTVAGIGKVGLHYISAPLLVKLNMGANTKVVLGPQVSYLANARIGLGSDLLSINYDGFFQKWDASLVGGLEYKLNKKTSLGARYLYGLNNINKNFDLGNNTFNDYFTMENSTAQFYVTLKL